MEKNVRPQNETWKVFGSDEVLEDKNLIEYYKLHQYDEKLSFKLLGDFTCEGKYVLPDEIKKILVGVKKLITYSGNDSYAAETIVKTQSIRFLIKYWFAGDKGVANLYFVENLDGEDLRTFVAQFVSVNDESFILRMKAAFNLHNELDELVDQYLEELEAQYAILQAKKAERDFVVELQSEFYLYEILEILKTEGGEKGKQIAEQIEIEIDSKKQLTNKEGMHTALRLKMDKMIIAAGGFNALKQKIPALPKIVQNYTKPVKDYDEISKKLDAMKPPTDEVTPNKSGGGKSNAKKSGAKKSGAKKGGKGGGKSGGKGKKNGGGKSAKKSDPKDIMLGSDAIKKWQSILQSVETQTTVAANKTVVKKADANEKGKAILKTENAKPYAKAAPEITKEEPKVENSAQTDGKPAGQTGGKPTTIISAVDLFGTFEGQVEQVEQEDVIESGYEKEKVDKDILIDKEQKYREKKLSVDDMLLLTERFSADVDMAAPDNVIIKTSKVTMGIEVPII